MTINLLITNGSTTYQPLVKEGITWSTERYGTPGKLTFTVIKDGVIDFQEGNPVSLIVDGASLFYGYIFSKRRGKGEEIDVVAYDQTRYLMNKDTYIYTNKTAGEVIEMLAADFNLQLGTMDKTTFKIPSAIEENATLFDIIQHALEAEMDNNKAMYIFYDDFGKLTLKSIGSMYVGLVIDEETGESFDYTTSIDDNTYNRVKLSHENEETGKRDIYVVQDGSNINKWGVLQYYDTLDDGENGQVKAEALLSFYNAKTRKLKVSKAFGDTRIRAGSMPIVKLGLGDMNLLSYMLVEKCVHTFNESEHWMDLTLRGGGLIG